MLKKINLKNKIALVTGAGKGIGKACAIALAEAGAKVIILSRTKSDLVSVSKIIKRTKGSSKSFVCDVTQVEEFKKISQITGLIMTKLDGTAKGGILLALAKKFKLPIIALGMGEQEDDLQLFNAEHFAKAIMSDEFN